jgi:hypothetical protein
MTGVLLLSEFGAGARIAGSILLGGHRTPSDFASLSPNVSGLWPVVVPLGEIVPRGVVCVGAQLAFARSAAGGAVCAGGVAAIGGACAIAALEQATTKPTVTSDFLICI